MQYKGYFTRQAFVEHHAEGVIISCFINLTRVVKLLRSRIFIGHQRLTGPGAGTIVGAKFGDTEVGQQKVQLATGQPAIEHIFGFDVAVNNVHRVHGPERAR